MESILYVNVFILLVLLSVNGQTPQSPCPGIFDYENDGNDIYGVIRLVPKAAVNYVKVRVNFTIAASIFGDYLGRLTPEGNTNNLNRGLSRGEPLKYRVDFPIKSPLPRLTGLTVNGRTLCSDVSEDPGYNSVITSITLEHTLYTSSGFGSIRPFYPTDFIDTTRRNELPDFDDFNAFGPIRPQNPPQRTTVPWVYATQPTPRTTQPPIQRPDVEIIEPYEPPYVAPNPPPTERATQRTPVTNVRTPVVQESNQYPCGRPKIKTPLIVNGEEYIRGAIPWLVAMFKQKKQELKFICAGTLVSDRHVVTAAHCLHLREQKTEIETIVVAVGAFDLDDVTDDETKKIYVKDATPHTGYNSFSLKNDILVLTLKKPVVFSDYIIPACLWSENSIDLNEVVGKRGVVAGWGTNEKHDAGLGTPRKAKIPIVSTDECQRSHEDFSRLTSDTTLCAGDRNNTSPCSGDSGGGLYLRAKGDQAWRLRGVISVSLESEDDDSKYECNIQQYVVFTDAAKFTPWIKSVMEST